MKRVLFVANGHGETAIAARIAEEFERAAGGGFALDLFPVVGLGAGAAPLALVGPRAAMPSGGLVAMGNVRAFARDVVAGFAGLFARQIRFLLSVRGGYDAVLAVGDIYALALAFIARAPTTYVGTAKSTYVAPYGPFERILMRRAKHAFVRDEPTARALRARGVDASAPGNVIVDLIRDPGAGETVSGRDGVAFVDALGIFPGSREEAYADGVRLARVVRRLAAARRDVRAIFSIAPTLDAERFARALAADGWTVAANESPHVPAEAPLVPFEAPLVPFEAPLVPFEATSAEGARLAAWRGSAGSLLRASALVLGQAGTANEQAAAYGVPVVALAGPAGREDWYRMRQRRLLGDALAIVPDDPAAAARAIDALLGDEPLLERMRTAGRERMGGAGGARAVADAVLADLRVAVAERT